MVSSNKIFLVSGVLCLLYITGAHAADNATATAPAANATVAPANATASNATTVPTTGNNATVSNVTDSSNTTAASTGDKSTSGGNNNSTDGNDKNGSVPCVTATSSLLPVIGVVMAILTLRPEYV